VNRIIIFFRVQGLTSPGLSIMNQKTIQTLQHSSGSDKSLTTAEEGQSIA
jgi:hypothetical protein